MRCFKKYSESYRGMSRFLVNNFCTYCSKVEQNLSLLSRMACDPRHKTCIRKDRSSRCMKTVGTQRVQRAMAAFLVFFVHLFFEKLQSEINFLCVYSMQMKS